MIITMCLPFLLQNSWTMHSYPVNCSLLGTKWDLSANEYQLLIRLQKSTTVILLKQLMATAAIIFYDNCLCLVTMPLTKFQGKLFNMSHGDEDLNMISQVKMMCTGKGSYSNLYCCI